LTRPPPACIRCAWLNHSDRPRRFIDLVERHPNIRMWFSGHFHLSQNYPDSISVVNQCAFVQTGVIGECNRDGNRCAGGVGRAPAAFSGAAGTATGAPAGWECTSSLQPCSRDGSGLAGGLATSESI
jgi:hypothetical protein